MRQYYYNGLTSSDSYNDWWDYSWYADVNNVLTCNDEMTTTFDFDVDPYFVGDVRTFSIAPDIVALSQSGEIRWGIHPDEQLYDFVTGFFDGSWVPFILLDTEMAGVYDTVIADLNFDLWFDEYDTMADKDDPVLNQDLGAYLDEPTEVMTGTQYVPAGFGAAGLPPTWWGAPDERFLRAHGDRDDGTAGRHVDLGREPLDA